MIKKTIPDASTREESLSRSAHHAWQRGLFLFVTLIALTSLVASPVQGAALQPRVAQSDTAITWDVMPVDQSRSFYNMGNHNSSGDPRTGYENYLYLAYGGDHLYFAYFDGTSWHSEVVDPSTWVGQYASFAIDGWGRYHISYYDAYNGRLMYVRGSAGGWNAPVAIDTPVLVSAEGENASITQEPEQKVWMQPRQRVADGFSLFPAMAAVTGGVGLYTSIAVDSYQHPRISYYDAVNMKLKYAWYDGIIWHTETVRENMTSYREGKYTSLAIGSADGVWDIPYISYLEDDHDNLRVAYKSATRWVYTTVDSNGNTGGYTSIAMDSSGKPHVAYCMGVADNNTCKTLKYTYLKKDTWTSPTIVDTENQAVGFYASLVLNSKGYPAISYYNAHNGTLKLAYNNGAAWVVKRINYTDANGPYGLYTTLAYDGDGDLHVFHVDIGNGLYREIYSISSKKAVQRNIDAEQDVGLATSIALDGANRPYISYIDATRDDLKMAIRPGGWSTSVISNSGTIGTGFTSIAIDSANHPHVAFYDANSNFLKYASYNGASWAFQTVDNLGNVGGTNAKLTMMNDSPLISYYDATDTNLRMAQIVSGSWVSGTVDSAGDVGLYSSIVANGATNEIYISYYNKTTTSFHPAPNLKMAYFSGSDWSMWYVDQLEDGDLGQFNSIALYNGHPMIAYYDATYGGSPPHYNRNLKLATGTLSGGSWTFTTEVVDSSDKVGKFNSLAVDPATGTPYISYYDETNKDLKVAYKVGGVWQIDTVDSMGDVGMYTSIALDSNGKPHVSYYDYTSGALKYAKDSSALFQSITIDPSLFNKAYFPMMASDYRVSSNDESVDLLDTQ